jgi:hypothetical protein
VLLGLAPVVAIGSSAAAASPTSTTAGTDTTSSTLTLTQWKHQYERDIGILADDVLVVVDDGKRAQTHLTKAKVRTTVNDCRQWASDAAEARTAAPPIPLAVAQRAWKSMIGASSRAANDCLSSLQRGSRSSAKDFQKQLALVERDEATLVSTLNR